MAKRKPAIRQRSPRNQTATASESPIAESTVTMAKPAPATVPSSIPDAEHLSEAAIPEKAAATESESAAAIPPIKPRSLEVYLIDSRWDTPVGAAVRSNIPAMAAYLKGQQFFVLTLQQSLAFLQKNPSLVGADPVLMVLDRRSAHQDQPTDCGFRLCLGHVKQPEVAVSMLKWAIQLTMTASAAEMLSLVRKSGQRQSVQGVIELMGESTHLLEFAPI